MLPVPGHFNRIQIHEKPISISLVLCSVVDPNSLNFDPDPEFWPNLDSDPGEKKNLDNFRENNFLLKIFFKTIRK